MLLAQVLDKVESSEKKNILMNTKFLNEHQRALVENMLLGWGNTKHVFCGGYEDAGRVVLAILPDYMEPEELLKPDVDPLAYISATYPTGTVISHRDFLGALMGCGINRGTVGDILVGDGRCDIIVLREMLQFVLQNLESAGHVKLNVSQIEIGELEVPQAEFRLIRDTVASLRLDSVVSSGYSISREKAAAAIKSGKVSLQHRECLKPDRTVNEGDVVSFRGQGRIVLHEAGGLTRKGRTGVVIKRMS